jgi:SNF2 family DNA or RNA helicase
MVEKFQNNPHEKVFILSIKAAGTGLNLTSANHVIHYDLWWNPAVESQATDRAFRIGQDKNVMVYRLITQGTFEEKINKMLTNKKELANLTVAAGEKWVGDLSDNELKQLFTLSE